MLCQVEGPWALYPSLAEKKQEYIVYEKELSTRESQRIFKKKLRQYSPCRLHLHLQFSCLRPPSAGITTDLKCVY